MSALHDSNLWVIAVFAVTYFGLATGRIPGLRTDRAGIALAGAAALLATGVLTLHDAIAAIDFSTLALLFGMMVVVGTLRTAGFFRAATAILEKTDRSSHALLAIVLAVSGILSAFLVNDVVCVALTPLVLTMCHDRRLPPVPFLMALATAANIGSVATLTGNPQNLIIGSFSGIPFLRFSARLAPVALGGLVIDFAILAAVYRRDLRSGSPPVGGRPAAVHLPLLAKSGAVTLAGIALFFAGWPVAIVALGAAAVLLLDRLRPSRMYAAIDWPLLMMFAGLFVVVHAFETRVVAHWDLARWASGGGSPIVMITALSALLSNLVSNVPAVLLCKPFVAIQPQAEQAWLALAMASTLAGNLTLVGSVANLIVAESARRSGTSIRFGEYLKVGIPVTLLTLLLGMFWLGSTHY